MEIDPKQARRVYLITYSQADISKFPTRESFGNAIAMAFKSSSKVKPTFGPVACKAMKIANAFTTMSHLR